MERTCPVCGTLYDADPKRLKFGRQTTCSKKCSYSLRGQKLTTSKEVSCANCGKGIIRCPSHLRSKHKLHYCSPDCKYQAERLGLVPHEISKKYTYTEESKARLLEAARRPKGKRVFHPPDVHHIKPIGSFSRPELGNTPDNLVSLCHPCHMLVEWNGMDFVWPKSQVAA